MISFSVPWCFISFTESTNCYSIDLFLHRALRIPSVQARTKAKGQDNERNKKESMSVQEKDNLITKNQKQARKRTNWMNKVTIPKIEK